MDFLYTKNITTTDDGTGVVHLVHILNGHGDEFGAVLEDIHKALLPLFGEVAFQIGKQIMVEHASQDREIWRGGFLKKEMLSCGIPNQPEPVL